jgi:U2 small nuclear ribonucleoprotein B''
MSTTTVTTTTQSLLPPNQTLYITNLNDKIRKADLRASLYTLFSTYGVVLDVVALKTMRGRGQAHVAFRDVASATGAMRALQGFEVLGKAMVRCGFFFFFVCCSSSCGAGSGRGEEVGLC